MKRSLLAVCATLVLVCAAALTVTLYAQHSFPVRFDDEEPERISAAATASTGVAVTDVLKLTPQDAPPFTCDATTYGSLYVQNDVCNTITFSDTLLCMCSDHQSGNAWVFINGNNDCADLQGPCP